MNPLEARERAIDIYQERASAAKRWRTIALVLAVAVMVLAVICGTLARSHRIIPYVVQVDRQGYEVALGPLKESEASNDRVIMARLARFVQTWRSITIDPQATKQNVMWLYTSIASGSNAQTTVDSWYKTNDVYNAAQSGDTTTAEVSAVLRVSDKTWRVEWIERRYAGGKPFTIQSWTGLFTIGITPPTDLSLVIKNPLGIYITDISATPNLNTAIN